MIKKRILLINRNLIAGGIETALISFVESLKEYADIEVMLFSYDGILKDKLPEGIKVIEGGKILKMLYRDYQINTSSNPTSSKTSLKGCLRRLLSKLGFKKLLLKLALVGQKNKANYDMAICYNGMDNLCANYAIKCVKAKHTINLIHSDISQFNLNKKTQKLFQKFNKIVCVSNSCAEIFRNKYPTLANKIDYMYNFQFKDKVINLANEKHVEYGEGLNFVTVARLAEEKAHLRTLKVLKKLHDEGFGFVWNIVGEGSSRKEIEDFIKLNDMQNYIVLHGNKKNPYPYIKSSDFLFLGSYHEAAPMVFAEAMFLGIPVVTTNTSSAEELIEDKGFICDNTEEGIYQILKQIFSDPNILKNKKKKLENYDVKTKEMICKVLSWSKS